MIELPCRSDLGELWFSEVLADIRQAQELCQPCPIREQCLAGALERREHSGVWGGEKIRGGEIVVYKRRGRPPRGEAA